MELVEPPAGAAVGERLAVAGYDCTQPDEQLNPKKKVWEAVSGLASRLVSLKPEGFKLSKHVCLFLPAGAARPGDQRAAGGMLPGSAAAHQRRTRQRAERGGWQHQVSAH